MVLDPRRNPRLGVSFETWLRYLRPNSCHAVSVLTSRDGALADDGSVFDARALETELANFESLTLAVRLFRGELEWPDAALFPEDFSATLEPIRAQLPSGEAATREIAESLEERLEWKTDSERGKYFVLVRVRTAADALVWSCAVAQAARMHSEHV